MDWGIPAFRVFFWKIFWGDGGGEDFGDGVIGCRGSEIARGGGFGARDDVTVYRKSYPSGVFRSAHPHPPEAGGGMVFWNWIWGDGFCIP